MGAADKLKTIAENIPKIYEEGYGDGYTQGESDGQKAEYDRFWDTYQRNGIRYGYYYAFAGDGWNDENFKPKYDLIFQGSSIYAFAYCQVTDLVDALEKCGVILDTSLSTSNNYMFYSAATKRLPPINLTGHHLVNSVFNNCSNLENIEKIIVIENNRFSDTFANCSNLKNITFEGVIGQNGLSFADSPLLTDATLRNIVGCLKDFTGTSETRSITFHADSVAKLESLTEDGKTLKQIANDKGWTVIEV